MTSVWKFIVSFLMGSIPFAKVAMLGTGVDITKVGSRNPGFNNVRRVGYPGRAVLTLVGDIAKGSVALLLFGRSWLFGLAAVAGHCWSPFLGFNGGKGVATTIGVLLILEPKITIACVPLYPILRFFGRKMGWNQEGAIASLTTMLVIASSVFALRGMEAGIYAFILFAIVAIRHAPNLREITGSIGG